MEGLILFFCPAFSNQATAGHAAIPIRHVRLSERAQGMRHEANVLAGARLDTNISEARARQQCLPLDKRDPCLRVFYPTGDAGALR